MKTPANQLFVLVTVLVGIAGTLWVAGRAGREAARVPAPADDEVRFVSAAPGPSESPLTVPMEGTHRGLVEQPLDEARCGTQQEEATLTAVIQDAGGGRIGGARLTVFACNGGVPEPRDFVEARGMDDGRACVRTPRNGEVLVAVFAPGYVPSARRVQATVGARIDLEPFVLAAGATVAGTVRIGGQPIARAEVEVVACPDCEVYEVGGLQYAWRDDRFVLARGRGETDANGKYVVAGLESGRQSVRLRAIRRPDVAVDVSKALQLQASAPAENVDFALPGARLRLDFRSSKGPVCCVDAQIEAGDRQFTRSSDESGRLDVIVQPALAYPITATRRGFASKHFQLRGLIDGESFAHTVDLEPQVALATVHIDDERSANVDEAVFQFRPKTPLMHGLPFERTIRRDARNGHFVIPEVPDGGWIVTMLSGRVFSAPSTMEGHAPLTFRSNCDADVVVAVPDSGEVYAKVAVLKRGGAEVIVRDASGARLSARGKLFDTRGAEVDAVMIKSELQTSFSGQPETRSDDPTFVYPLTCYGTFQLAVHMEGFEPVRVSLTTSPGRMTPLDVVLVPQ